MVNLPASLRPLLSESFPPENIKCMSMTLTYLAYKYALKMKYFILYPYNHGQVMSY